MPLQHIKDQLRILGVDDARFKRGRDKWTRLVGVVHRGGQWIEGCLQAPIQVDGDDVTPQLTKMVKESNHYEQLRVIMTRDTIFAGTNILDLPLLAEDTGLPVIAISDSEPKMERVKRALQHYCPKTWGDKLAVLERCGPIQKVESQHGRTPVFLQWAGIPYERAVEVVRMAATRSRIPEPVRVAHIIASSFVPNP